MTTMTKLERVHATAQQARKRNFPRRFPVAFDPEDSHTTYTAAPGAAPVFDGGEVLTGWKVGTRNGHAEWTLDRPEVAASNWFFRSLFVNCRRAPRARLPKFSPDAEGTKRGTSGANLGMEKTLLERLPEAFERKKAGSRPRRR